MSDEIKPQSLPAKRKLALTEDEHALIESYRQKNLAVDSFNAGIDKAIELVTRHETLETSLMVGILARQRKQRISPL